MKSCCQSTCRHNALNSLLPKLLLRLLPPNLGLRGPRHLDRRCGTRPRRYIRDGWFSRHRQRLRCQLNITFNHLYRIISVWGLASDLVAYKDP